MLCAGDTATAPKLRIIPDGTGVHGVEELIVKNSSDIYSLLDRGSAKRKTAATLLNKGSSRSHSVFCVTVRCDRIIGRLFMFMSGLNGSQLH